MILKSKEFNVEVCSGNASDCDLNEATRNYWRWVAGDLFDFSWVSAISASFKLNMAVSGGDFEVRSVQYRNMHWKCDDSN